MPFLSNFAQDYREALFAGYPVAVSKKKTSQGTCKLKIPLCTCTYCSMMAAMFQDGGLTYLDRSSSLLQIDHLAENIINTKKVTI